jgi:anthranilate synthase component 1
LFFFAIFVLFVAFVVLTFWLRLRRDGKSVVSVHTFRYKNHLRMGNEVRLTPVVREIPADLETPVSAYLKLAPAGAMFLLESVELGESLGRYSFIGAGALERIAARDGGATIDAGGRTGTVPLPPARPLTLVRDRLRRYAIDPHPSVPRLLGGAVGFVSYDYVRTLERLPARLPEALGLPLFEFVLADTLVVFDHVRRKLLLVALDAAGPEAAGRPPARERIDALARALAGPLPPPPSGAVPGALRARFASDAGEARFCEAVRRAKRYIGIGDIFQGVLSHRLTGGLAAHPFQVYRALRILNPSPYMFYLDFGSWQLVGSSPEVHAKLERGTAVIRPIAGTRPRGASPEEDERLAGELLADEKERAEHVMLIDLARNDLGRCCAFGSVRVTELMAVEKYSHVQHIVSEVAGTLGAGRDAFDLFDATFPAGTVSGAPKVRAMEIIEELEHSRRGPYAGTVGYFGLGGEMDMAITIRTMVTRDAPGGRLAHLQGGAGIVADSDPAREWTETMNKMAALEKAVRMAEDGF